MTEQENSAYKLPNSQLWEHVAKIAIVEDKPIMMDYWVDSIAKIYKVQDTYIICTENSIYLAHSDIPTKKIT
jgi:hypothetical protein